MDETAGAAAMSVEPREDAGAAKGAAAAGLKLSAATICGRIPNSGEYQGLRKCYEMAQDNVDGSNQEKLTLTSITKFNKSDTHHDYGNLAGIEEIKYFAPDPTLVTPGSMSEEATYRYASKMVGVNDGNPAYTCTPILMAYGKDAETNKANGKCLYDALIASGITDPVFIVDVIKSTVFGAMSNPPPELGDTFPVLLQTTSTLCDPGPKRTRPRGDVFPGAGAMLKWGFSPGNMMYPAWGGDSMTEITRNLMARDTGSEIPYALGINTKAFQILLNPGDAPENYKAAVVIINPTPNPNGKLKIYYLEKEHTTKKVKAFRDSAFLNAIKNSFKPVKVVVEDAIRAGGPVMLHDLSLAANVLGKRMGDGCQCLQASMNNLSWFHNDIAQSGGTAGLVTYDKNCAAYALEVGAPFVIYESYADNGDDAPVWCNVLTRRAFKKPSAQLINIVEYAHKVMKDYTDEYTKVVSNRPAITDPTTEGGLATLNRLIVNLRSGHLNNEQIQKSFTDYLTLLNNAIPKIVNQNNFNNAFIDAENAMKKLVAPPGAPLELDKLLTNANQLIESLAIKPKDEELTKEEQAYIAGLLSQIQSSTALISSFNEKAKTTIELHELVKATGVKGDKIISDSIGEIKLAELVKKPERRSRMAACKSMLRNFVNKIRRNKTNSFLNDATLLTGAGSVIGPLYRILVNVNPRYANTLMEYAYKINGHFGSQAAGRPDLVQVFQDARLQLEAISPPVPAAGAADAAAGAAVGLSGGGRGAAAAPQMYGGSVSIDDLLKMAFQGNNIYETMNTSLSELHAEKFIKSVDLLVNSLISQQILNNIIITVNGILTAYEYSWVLSPSQKPDNRSDERFSDLDRLIDPEVASNPGSVQEYLNQIAKYLVKLGYTNDVDDAPLDTDIVIYDNKVVDIQSRVSNPFGLYDNLKAYSDAVDGANLKGFPKFPQSRIPDPLSLFAANGGLLKLLEKIPQLGELAESLSESIVLINNLIDNGRSILIKGLINSNKQIKDEIRTTIANTVKDIVTELTKFLNSQSSEFDTRRFSNIFCTGEYFMNVFQPLEVEIKRLWDIIGYNNVMISHVEEMYAEPSDAQSSQESGYGSETSEENEPYSAKLKMLENVYSKICKDSKVALIGTLQGELKQLQQDKQTLINTLLQNEEELVKSRSELDQKNSDLQKNLKELESLNEKIGKERITEVPAAAAAAVAPIMANVVSRKRSLDEVDPAVERTRSGKRLDPGTTIFIEEKIESLNNEIAQLNENIKELEGQIEALSGQMQELEGEIQLKNTEIVAEQDKALETINKMIDKLNNRFFPPKMGGLGGGKRRTMKNKSKSKRNARNQTHRKRKGKAVGKRTATAHRPKTARNAKKITKKSTSNTKTKRSAKPTKKRAINRRARNARNARKDRK